jgi:hypothetical protein
MRAREQLDASEAVLTQVGSDAIRAGVDEDEVDSETV